MKVSIQFKTGRELEASIASGALKKITDGIKEAEDIFKVSFSPEVVFGKEENADPVNSAHADTASELKQVVDSATSAQVPTPLSKEAKAEGFVAVAPQVPQTPQTPQAPTEPEKPAYSAEILARAAAQMITGQDRKAAAAKQADLIAVLQEFGVPAIPALKPNQLDAFAKKLKEMGADI